MADHRLWTGEWKRLRAAVAVSLPRPCGKCGQPVRPTDRWHLSHRVPRSKGGPDSLANVEPWHARCNLAEAPRLAWEATLRQRRADAEAARRRWVEADAAWQRPAAVEVEKSRIF